MFGVREENRTKEMHFANAAKRFAMDAKMFRCRAAVHVENKDDVVFWSRIFEHFRPHDQFHFIAGSRNEYGHETSGVTQCMKYFSYLNPSFFICIDSDYRYLLREKKIDVEHFVFQTYTYSFENHHCYADGLEDVCCRVTHLGHCTFDFRKFLTDFSHILYDLFIWHLYFQNADPLIFSKNDFNNYISLATSKIYPVAVDNAARALDELRMRVERRVSYFGRKYPKADLECVRRKYEELGLSPDTVYFFIRGHNLYDIITFVCKEVCKAMLRAEKRNKTVTNEMIRELYRGRNSLDEQLRQNMNFGAYLPIQKIEDDIVKFLGRNEVH
ncbi:MAG: DUF4435 domain-containing protein [Odoribacter sp.]